MSGRLTWWIERVLCEHILRLVRAVMKQSVDVKGSVSPASIATYDIKIDRRSRRVKKPASERRC
jgi:hypothetical protein